MKISTRGRYALKLMIDLATNDNGDPIKVKEIAERQGISEKYLEQIVAPLNKAGYVRSVRGAQGGYFLRKKPEEYTVGMILRLIEGSLAPVSCVEAEEAPCEHQRACSTFVIWQRINAAVNEVVDNITLQDLVDWQSEKPAEARERGEEDE